MGFLIEAKADLEGVLTAAVPDITVLDYSPEVVRAPAAHIFYGAPMVSEGQTFSDRRVRFEVQLVIAPAANDRQTAELGTLIERIALPLIREGFDLEEVRQPYMLAANNTHYLAADAIISTLTTLT